jgi:hypothetical protein
MTCQLAAEGAGFMKPQLALAFVVATAPALAQSTGVSHPPDAPVEDLQPLSIPAQTKPSAAIPMQPTVTTPSDSSEFKPYQPYNDVAATGSTATLHPRIAEVDPDAGIVTQVPRRPNELPIGTAIRARLRASIETQTTQRNAPFTAELSEDVRDGNKVVLPAGAVVEGIVTQARGGKRFRGAALIHLQAQRVTLPDGTSIPLQAQVVDTDQFAETRIDGEGNIIRKDHAAATILTMSGVTGVATVTGAVIGGGVGALVGAGIGVGVSTIVWLKQDRQARLPQDALLTFSLTDPMDLKPQPDFVMAPRATPYATPAPVPAPQAYVAPQAFVPTN